MLKMNLLYSILQKGLCKVLFENEGAQKTVKDQAVIILGRSKIVELASKFGGISLHFTCEVATLHARSPYLLLHCHHLAGLL